LGGIGFKIPGSKTFLNPPKVFPLKKAPKISPLFGGPEEVSSISPKIFSD